MATIRSVIEGLFGGRQPKTQDELLAAIEKLRSEAARETTRADEHQARVQFLTGEAALGEEGLAPRIAQEQELERAARSRVEACNAGIAGLQRRLREHRVHEVEAERQRLVELAKARAKTAARLAGKLKSTYGALAVQRREFAVAMEQLRELAPKAVEHQPIGTSVGLRAVEDLLIDQVRGATSFGTLRIDEVEQRTDLVRHVEHYGATVIDAVEAHQAAEVAKVAEQPA